jgi:hypothetical protein
LLLQLPLFLLAVLAEVLHVLRQAGWRRLAGLRLQGWGRLGVPGQRRLLRRRDHPVARRGLRQGGPAEGHQARHHRDLGAHAALPAIKRPTVDRIPKVTLAFISIKDDPGQRMGPMHRPPRPSRTPAVSLSAASVPAMPPGLDDRGSAILRELVEIYVATGEPVGSRTLSRRLPHALSPATIRNVMADLEEAGLLYAPHTSAGRLPTERGLRLFVDGL